MNFLQNIPYERLLTYEMIIIIILVTIAFFSSLKEERKWVIMTYVVVGVAYAILCVIKLLNEGLTQNTECYRTVIKAVLAVLCTTAWAVLLGKRIKETNNIPEDDEQE